MTTPTCPACGVKFAHSPAMQCCTRCGLPDEVLNGGPKAIARWKRRPTGTAAVGNVLVPGQRLDNLSKRQRKLARALHGGSAGRKRSKHGRQHVAR